MKAWMPQKSWWRPWEVLTMWFENWSPFFDVGKTLEEMDRILNAVGRPLSLRSVPRGTFPAINVYDQGQALVMTAEAPGMKSGDFELTVLGDSLTIKGERKVEESEQERYYRRERPMGAFTRTVTLPTPVDTNSVKAEYRDGVLRVYMEKAEEAKAKKIKIAS
ncbi:MAG: Hsp20/alpha crystallin family protein [Phycisphaerae bacterium]|nr:Hsp20/alpha crystallin family protein [Phycisphaerae bacterium]